MIPEGEDLLTLTSDGKNDVLLAGYKECANEALNWLLNLGYAPGHPLIKSLAAHLTKKQAYLEKLSLERFLIDETLKYSEKEFDENEEVDPDFMESAHRIYAYQIKCNTQIQKALVNAVFKGCDLQYSKNS